MLKKSLEYQFVPTIGSLTSRPSSNTPLAAMTELCLSC